MRSIIVVTVVAGAVLTGCGTSAPAAKTLPTKSPSAVVTTLPELGNVTTDERVLVPLTHGVGGRGFAGGTFDGKTLYIEIACLGGSYTVSYAGGSMHSTCDGTPEMIGDEVADFRAGRATSFTLNTNARWVFRVTEAK